MIKDIRIVLLETSHPGNIGAVARAMKNMGLSQLYLVNPKHFPSAEASARAASAHDLLEKAVVCDNFLATIADCQLVLGTCALKRDITQLSLTPKEAIEKIKAQYQNTKIAFVFGRESTGMTNEELQHCHAQLHIPTNPEYSSLNLGAAVQVIAYELWQAFGLQNTSEKNNKNDYATSAQQEFLYAELERLMIATGFHNPEKPRSLNEKIRHIFTKAQLTTVEMDVLMGFLKSIKKA